MGLWPFDEDPPAGALAPGTVRTMLREALDLKEHALIATPYLSFPGRICGLSGEELRLTTSLTKDTAQRTLQDHPLRLRLPWGLSMVAGPVRYKGHVQDSHRREIILTRPPWLAPDERRRYPRCEIVGRSTVTLTREDLQQVRGRLESLSMGGAGVFILDADAAPLLAGGAAFELGLRLDQGPELRAWARVAQGEFPRLGFTFTEPLAAADAARLQEWLKPRLDEAQRRWENRKALRAQAEAAALARAQPARPAGVLIVGSQLFGEEVREAIGRLEDPIPVRVGPPAMASLKPLLDPPPQLVVLQTAESHLDERYRLSSLVQAMNLNCPLILLGTGAPGSAQKAGAGLKAYGIFQWTPKRPRLFLQAVRGLILQAPRDEEGETSGQRD